MRLALEVEGIDGEQSLPGDGAALIAFMSFAVSRGFGAIHPLITLADRLHDEHGVRMGPLTTFYEAEAEDAEDREKLEMAWQDVPSLRAALQGLVGAFENDPQCAVLARRGEGESIPDEAKALIGLLNAAGERRVRLVYAL